jgi:hypothetical protein
MTSLSDADLDATYTHLCKTLTRLGEAHMPMFLARLALLAVSRMDSGAAALELIDSAAEDLEAGADA